MEGHVNPTPNAGPRYSQVASLPMALLDQGSLVEEGEIVLPFCRGDAAEIKLSQFAENSSIATCRATPEQPIM